MPDNNGLKETSQHEPSTQNINFVDTISKANAYNPEWLTNEPLRERQKKILEAFPDQNTLIKQLTEHYLRNYKREEQYAKKTRKEVRHSDLRKVIRGELFEQLVATENRLFNMSAESAQVPAPEKKPADSSLEETLTDFLRQPDKYGFDHLWPMRNPDLSFVETRNETLIVLTGTGEAKSAKSLDYRAYRQLRPDGLRKTLELSILGINQLDENAAKDKGLEGFGKGGKKLAMIRHFTQHVIMCRDVDFSNPDYLIDRSGFYNEADYNDFKQMLLGKHEESKVKLVHSSFSENELDAIFKTVISQIENNLTR